MSALDNWCTSPEVADPLERFFDGPVGLDPCSNDQSIIRCRRRYTAGGLHLPWDAPTLYENPPYSRLEAWSDKAVRELADRHRGKKKELVRLVPVATSTVWWMISVRADPLLCFTRRLSFLNEKGELESTARFDSVLMLWAEPSREAEFLRCFGAVIRCVTRGRRWSYQ